MAPGATSGPDAAGRCAACAVAAFVADYGATRRTPLSDDGRAAMHAAAAYVLAYTARCEHALGLGGDFTAALSRHGEGYLAT